MKESSSFNMTAEEFLKFFIMYESIPEEYRICLKVKAAELLEKDNQKLQNKQ